MMKQSRQTNTGTILVYLNNFPPTLFVKHSLFHVHLVEELGFLNLLLCDHLAFTEHSKL